MALRADDAELFDELESAQERQRRAFADVDAPGAADVAALAGANRRAYPYLKAGDALALARAGEGPGSEVTREAARRRAARKVKNGFGFADLGTMVKGVSRVAFTALGTPLEELQGVIRGAGWGGVYTRTNDIDEGVGDYFSNVGYGIRNAGRATGTKALEDLIAGRKVDLGSGYLPGGKLAAEHKRDSEILGINGQPISTGRVIAHRVSEPGTKPYKTLSGLIDFSIAVGADPANLAGVKLAEVRKANKLFVPVDKPTILRTTAQRAGLIDGVRKTVEPDRVAQWLDSPDGRKVVEGIADEPDFDALWRRLGKKAEVADVLELAAKRTPQEVRDYLEPLLGVTIREKPALARPPSSNPVVRRVRDARLFQGMPGSSIDFDDPDRAVRTVDDWLRNAGVRDPEIIAKHTTAMAKATSAGATGADRFQAVTAAAKAAEDSLLTFGTPVARARELTSLFTKSTDELRKYNVDDIGANAWFPGVKVDGANAPAASPHLIVEALNSKVMLPDAREIRRLTSRYKNLLQVVDLPLTTLEHLQAKIWRPMVLLRGAYVPRVVGEEQLRMAGAGFDSFANHPLSALATVVGDDGRLGRVLAKVPGVETGRAEVDVFGEAFADAARRAPDPTAYEQALYKGRVAEPVGRARAVTTSYKTVYAKDAPEYAKGWADELMQLRADPIGQRVAHGGILAGDRSPSARVGIYGLKDWFWEGTGRKLREDLAEQGIDVTTRAQADAYVDTVVERLRVKTGGNPELMDAVATGVFRGEALRAGDKLNPKFVRLLDDVKDAGPTRVKGDLTVAARGAQGELSARYDAALNHAFSALMVRPSNWLSRSTTFRQSYYQRISELAPFMATDARAAIVKAADEAKMGTEYLTGLRSRIAGAAKPGRLSLEEADLIAKGHALEATRDLLYDIADKGQLSDQLRLLIPFGEAFKEQITRWSKITTQNPRTLRRAQQTIEGARGNGWFFEDSNGEESFRYPGTAFLSEHLLGAPVPLTGRVAGLSLAGNLLPGFGPVVQIPAAMLIPNKPEADWVRQIFLPFGEPDTEGGFAESFLPAWAKRFHTALRENDPETDRLFGNSVMDMAAYLVSTGDYTTDSPEAVDRLMADATTKAKRLFLLRGFAQYFAPSAPSPEFLAADSDGNLMVARKLVQEYHELQADNYETATETFLDTYGEGALLLMQPKTRGGARPTEALDDWSRRHPEVREKYGSVYGFFGPQSGEFSLDFYGRQLRSGERTPITPNEAVALANDRVAKLAYRQAKEQVAGRTDIEARQWLAGIREQLLAQFPGYEPMPRDLGKTDRTIRDLAHAAKDPLLASTDAGQGIAAYLEARAQAVEASKRDLGLTSGFGKAKSARYLRDYLRDVAAAIAEEYPDFAEAWDFVLSRELTDDEPELGEAA